MFIVYTVLYMLPHKNTYIHCMYSIFDYNLLFHIDNIIARHMLFHGQRSASMKRPKKTTVDIATFVTWQMDGSGEMQSRRDTKEDVSSALNVTVENTASVAMDSDTMR